jgi:hypothetical protein
VGFLTKYNYWAWNENMMKNGRQDKMQEQLIMITLDRILEDLKALKKHIGIEEEEE